MKKLKAYLLNVLNGLGIFLNTLVFGSPSDSLFKRVWEMLKDARDTVVELWSELIGKFKKKK
jgi:hypothetical protein